MSNSRRVVMNGDTIIRGTILRDSWSADRNLAAQESGPEQKEMLQGHTYSSLGLLGVASARETFG